MAETVAFDNPLMPSARLREMYLAMMRLSALEHSLHPKSRSGVLGLEACLVGSSVGLVPGDLVSDSHEGAAMCFLRGQALHRALEPNVKSRKRGLLADCGAATTLPTVRLPYDRLWAALGAAAGLQAKGGVPDVGRNAVVLYARAGEVAGPDLRRMLQHAGEHLLPVLFITLPRGQVDCDGTLSTLINRSGVPAISVDLEDAVAVYRVVQESLGRARSGGGPAVMECVPFACRGTSGRPGRETNGPLGAIEAYMLERNVVTRAWIAAQSRAMARHLRKPVN